MTFGSKWGRLGGNDSLRRVSVIQFRHDLARWFRSSLASAAEKLTQENLIEEERASIRSSLRWPRKLSTLPWQPNALLGEAALRGDFRRRGRGIRRRAGVGGPLVPDQAAPSSRCPSVARIAFQVVEVITEAVALQPGQSCLEFRQGHLTSALVAEHPLQHRIVAVVEPLTNMRHLQAGFILHCLSGHGLTDASPSRRSVTDGGSIRCAWSAFRSRRASSKTGPGFSVAKRRPSALLSKGLWCVIQRWTAFIPWHWGSGDALRNRHAEAGHDVDDLASRLRPQSFALAESGRGGGDRSGTCSASSQPRPMTAGHS